MDVDTRRDIEQVELELQHVQSRRNADNDNNDQSQQLNVQQTPNVSSTDSALSISRRRLSSHSNARSNVPNLSAFKQQQQQDAQGSGEQKTTDLENVFVEEEEDDDGEIKKNHRRRHSNASSSKRSQQTRNSTGVPLPSDTSNLPTAANSTEHLATSAAAAAASALASSSTPSDRISGEPHSPSVQKRPAEIKNATAEILFILVCSTGQLLFGFLQGGVAGLQLLLIDRLGIPASQTPWLQGAFLLANGLSVIVSGPIADVVPPKYLMCGAYAWQAGANIIGVFSLSNKYLFFTVRGLQGLSVGVLVSSSLSVLGRVYQPGLRKTRVFSIMAAMAPLGFWLGTLQGGALSSVPKWIFASNSIIAAACCAAGLYCIPNVRPALAGLSMRSFDYYGSAFAVVGCALLVAGLTQGPSADWKAYTIVLTFLGLAAMVAFFFVERKVQRPLLPPALWRVPGFTALIISYFLGFGSFLAWQFYAIQFWLKIQHASPLLVALYLTPNAIFGVFATFLVSRIAHLVAGHWILAASMLAFAMGPVFFLPQTASTTYWALSMPGIAIVTFGPDLSFAAASIFVTSSVAKHYQGSAGSLLVTVQNLSAAIMTSISDTIGERMTSGGNERDLKTFHSIWWFDFAAAIVGTVITLCLVRIPKTVEKEHEQ